MSNELLQQLETKVDAAIEVIELLRLQVEELEDANNRKQEEIAKLTEANTNYETNINSLLDKLAQIEATKQEEKVENFATEMEPA